MNRLNALVFRYRTSTMVDTRSLAMYRILLGMWFMVTARWDTWLMDVPPTFFEPPFLSLANLFDRFPSSGFFHVLNGLGFAFATLFMVGFRTRLVAIGLLMTQLIYYSFQFSLGKIDHSILLPSVLFVMSFAACSEYWSMDAWLKRKRGYVPLEHTDLALLGVFIAVGFFTAGFGKALVWLDFNTDTGGFLAWMHSQYYNANRTLLLASWAIHMPWPRLWEAVDIFAVIFELGFFWALLKRRRWLMWITLWCCFHLMNTLLLNIAFLPNAFVVMAFVPWVKLIDLSDRRLRIFRAGAVVTMGGMFMIITASRTVILEISATMGLSNQEWSLIARAAVWFGLLIIFAQQSLLPSRTQVSAFPEPVSQEP